MERLTKITEIGNAYFPKCFEEPCCGMGKCIDNNCNLVNEVCKKLAEYEQLEEQGLLVRLPCKVGTVVYRIESRGWTKSSICGKSFSEDCEYCEEKKCDSRRKYEIYSQEMFSQEWIFGNRNGFGRTIFFTREEAERKLEEMKAND